MTSYKTLLIALLPLAVGLLVGFLLAPKQDKGLMEELEKQDAAKALEIETLKTTTDSLTLVLNDYITDVSNAREKLKIEQNKTIYWRKRYEAAKTAPPRMYNEHQLDSILTIRYPK